MSPHDRILEESARVDEAQRLLARVVGLQRPKDPQHVHTVLLTTLLTVSGELDDGWVEEGQVTRGVGGEGESRVVTE